MRFFAVAALVVLSLLGIADAQQNKAPATSAPAKDFRKSLPGTNSTFLLRNKGECTKPYQHREWRKMTKQNQQDFINAVKCSTQKAAMLTKKAKGAKNRFDDFCAVHIIQADTTHVVGHFLPWHRLYIAMYEEYLAAECGYTGGLPYWDFALDAADEKTFLSSPVLAADAFGSNGLKTTKSGAQQGGFAMNGRTGGGCIQDGAFKDFVVNMGPNTSLKGNPRCIERDLVPNLISNFKPAALAKLMAAKTHAEFDSIIEQTPNFSGGGIDWNNSGVHNGAHFILGGSWGTLGNTYASCGDPAFFLVHGYLDKLWWDWQNANPNRLYEIGGKQANGQPVTLDLAMNLEDLTSPFPFTVRDVMDIKAGPLCYEYKD